MKWNRGEISLVFHNKNAQKFVDYAVKRKMSENSHIQSLGNIEEIQPDQSGNAYSWKMKKVYFFFPEKILFPQIQWGEGSERREGS